MKDQNIEILLEKIYNNERISPAEGLLLFNMDFLSLLKAGDHRRRLAYPEEKIGFIIDRIVNFTNVCEAKCDFCAFHSKAGELDAYLLSEKEIFQKVEELVAIGGTQLMLQGGLNPNLTLDYYIKMVRTIREKFPDLYLHCFSPAEIFYLAKKDKQTISQIIGELKDAGINSIPGASDLLVDSIRQRVSPKKITVREWQDFVRVIKDHGMTTTATMTYGMGETNEDKISHLEVVRKMQDETGAINCFIPWSFSPANTKMSHLKAATGVDYLKMVAISRIYLDNILHMQAGWLTEGLKMAQLALKAGATDMGGVLMEEQVVRATGVKNKTNKEEIIEIIENTGKIPVQRDSRYGEIKILQVDK